MPRWLGITTTKSSWTGKLSGRISAFAPCVPPADHHRSSDGWLPSAGADEPRPLPSARQSVFRLLIPVAEIAQLPDLAPLACEREGCPEIRVGVFLQVQQGQLRFPPCFCTGLAGAPAPDEFRHQLAGGLVAHLPMARQHGLRAGDAEGPPQRHHTLANLHLA